MPSAPFPTGDAANYVPEIFSKKLQAKFYASSVLPAITNSDWEGEIAQQGDTVHIRRMPDITVSNYAGSVTYEGVDTTQIDLLIDKAKYYAFKVDDIQKAQSDLAFWNDASKEASESMRITVETEFLADIYTAAGNTVDTASVLTPATALDAILEAGTKLDENNVPEDGRWIVLPPWVWENLKKSDLKAVHISGDGTSPLRNGEVGMIDRFKVHKSNMLFHQTAAGADQFKTMCLAGTSHFACFASQFVKNETVRLETTFGDGVRGLKTYGYKATKPEAGVVLKLKKA